MTDREAQIQSALTLLKSARNLLVMARAPRAAQAVRKAMKSTEGAIRHSARGTL